jgi:serine/threonine protein kinase
VLTRPPELAPILDGLLRVDPDERTSSAEALVDELRHCRRQLPDPPTPRAAPDSIARTRRSRPSATEQELRGLLDHLRERREHMAREPGVPLWQLLLPPALLAALILVVAWLLWQAT